MELYPKLLFSVHIFLLGFFGTLLFFGLAEVYCEPILQRTSAGPFLDPAQALVLDLQLRRCASGAAHVQRSVERGIGKRWGKLRGAYGNANRFHFLAGLPISKIPSPKWSNATYRRFREAPAGACKTFHDVKNFEIPN